MIYISAALFFFALAVYFRKNPRGFYKKNELGFKIRDFELTNLRLIALGLSAGVLAMLLTGAVFWLVALTFAPYATRHYHKRTKQKERAREARRNMLSAIQLLWIPCNAGLSFRESVKKLNAETDNFVIKELERCYSEVSAGKRKEVAYKDLVKRTIPELESLIMAVSHVEGAGEPISDFLKREIEKNQAAKRAKIQEIGDKIGNKVLYIVIVIMGPAFLFLLFGPVMDRFQGLTNIF